MGEWREKALCSHPAIDPNLFVDVIHGEPQGTREARVQQAAYWCQRCTVRDECLAEGIANRESGIWGKTLLAVHVHGYRQPSKPIYTAAEERARRNQRDRDARARRNEAS